MTFRLTAWLCAKSGAVRSAQGKQLTLEVGCGELPVDPDGDYSGPDGRAADEFEAPRAGTRWFV